MGDSAVTKTDLHVGASPIPNIALAEAMKAKDVSPRRLAQRSASLSTQKP